VAARAVKKARTSATSTRRAPQRGAVRSPPSVAHILDALRGRIARQDIAPGAKLRETDLAAEFGVPRTRVRDALNALEQRGLVERIPNRGAVVTRLDLSQVFYIYDLREVLEGLCARLATEKGPVERWRKELELFRGPMKEFVARNELDQYIERYEAMRRGIIEAAGNPVLAEMLDTIYEKTQVLIRRILILPGRAEVGRRQHVAMLEAMCKGDAELAEKLRREGLRSAKAHLEKFQKYIL
jgi:DNA-binding GntR family transcriptional regulator